jgi:tRNA(Ile)-lysidine synthase
MEHVIESVRTTVLKYRLLERDDLVLVAVSGGCDSVFLLRCLHMLKGEFHIRLVVAHLNHMLREDEAERDAHWVENLCAELSLDCVTGSRDVRTFSKKNDLSLEEAARICRYDFLEETRNKVHADRIALGHTADDQAETLLLRLLRGSGRTGLASMLPKRGYLVRPLLALRRQEIRDYLDGNDFQYLDDSSNADTIYTRNLIRHKIVPLIESTINPSLVPLLARTATVLSEEDAFLEAIAQEDLERIARKDGPGLRLDLEALMGIETARRRRVLRKAICAVKGNLRNIGAVHIDKVLELLEAGSSGSRISIHSLEVYRDYDSLIIAGDVPTSAPEFKKSLSVPGMTTIEEAKLSLTSSVGTAGDVEVDRSDRNRAYFDFDELLPPVFVRNRRPGDRFVPFSHTKAKKLKEMFIDDKLPRRKRDVTPIVADGGGILWIPGERRSDRAPVTSKTERVLCIEARKGTD